MRRCACGQHAGQAAHRATLGAEALSNDFIEAAAVRAPFPQDATRRR